MNARMPHWLALITVLIVGVVEGSILHYGAPPGLDGVVLGRVLGTMDSALIMVLSYYFGSSAQNALKPDMKPTP
jgi:Na+-driven multidrug efflux pump